jgi:hypothetical protein
MTVPSDADIARDRQAQERSTLVLAQYRRFGSGKAVRPQRAVIIRAQEAA